MFREFFALPKDSSSTTNGMKIDPYFTKKMGNIYDTAEWETISVTTGSGKVISDVEFPAFWSENARIQVAEKYFRRADVPQFPEGILDRHQAEAAVLGRQVWIFHHTGRCRKLLPRNGIHDVASVCRPEFASVVQYGNALGIRDFLQSQGPVVLRF